MYVKAIGGGVRPKILDFLCFLIFKSPGYEESGTFYRIEISYRVVEILRVKVGYQTPFLTEIASKWVF